MLPNSPVTAQAAVARPSRNAPVTAGMTYALNLVTSLVGLARDTLKRSHVQFRCACLPSSRTQSALDASCGRFCRRAGDPRHRPECKPARHGGEISSARRVQFGPGDALL